MRNPVSVRIRIRNRKDGGPFVQNTVLLKKKLIKKNVYLRSIPASSWRSGARAGWGPPRSGYRPPKHFFHIFNCELKMLKKNVCNVCFQFKLFSLELNTFFFGLQKKEKGLYTILAHKTIDLLLVITVMFKTSIISLAIFASQVTRGIYVIHFDHPPSPHVQP